MKRCMAVIHGALTCLLVGWGVSFWVADWMAAVRSQLDFGYAVSRSGRPYNLWLWMIPLCLAAALLGAMVIFWVVNVVGSRNAGRQRRQTITYRVSPKCGPRRLRKRRR